MPLLTCELKTVTLAYSSWSVTFGMSDEDYQEEIVQELQSKIEYSIHLNAIENGARPDADGDLKMQWTLTPKLTRSELNLVEGIYKLYERSRGISNPYVTFTNHHAVQFDPDATPQRTYDTLLGYEAQDGGVIYYPVYATSIVLRDRARQVASGLWQPTIVLQEKQKLP